MNLLLDTHIFLWYIFGVSKLKVLDKEIIENSENQVFISDYSISIVHQELIPILYSLNRKDEY